jgi:hypothetical protein
MSSDLERILMVRIRQLAKFCTATRRAFGNELVGGLAYGFGHLIARLDVVELGLQEEGLGV